MVHHGPQLRLELGPGLAVAAAEEPVGRIPQVNVRHQGGGDDQGVIASAAAGHILPDQHTVAVAMVVPAQGLHLDVFAQHVEAHGLGGADVIDHGLVRRGGIKPVGPIALIQQAVVEVRPVI